MKNLPSQQVRHANGLGSTPNYDSRATMRKSTCCSSFAERSPDDRIFPVGRCIKRAVARRRRGRGHPLRSLPCSHIQPVRSSNPKSLRVLSLEGLYFAICSFSIPYGCPLDVNLTRYFPSSLLQYKDIGVQYGS